MKLWSRGLGRTEIDMDFRYYKVTKDKETGNICIIGNMHDPVNWEFRIMMEPDDLPGLVKVLLNGSVILYVIKNFFRCFIYLFNRKKYKEEGDLEQKVMNAYKKLTAARTTGSRKKISRMQSQELNGDLV